MTNTFNYLRVFKSMDRASYPYTGTRGTCKYNAAKGIVNVSAYRSISSGDVAGHIAAL